MKRACLLMTCLFFSSSAPAADLPAPCDHFYRELVRVPHQQLTAVRNVSPPGVDGCSVVFRSSADLMDPGYRLPSFLPDEGTVLYGQGWRIDHQQSADGPGSGRYTIVRKNWQCVIQWDRHAWIDEQTHTIKKSELINMAVRCRLPDHGGVR